MESAEKENPIWFFESWLPEKLHVSVAKGCIKVDQAHRAAAPKGKRPLLVIIKLHNSWNKLRIISAVRIMDNIEHGGPRIFIHQDSSSSVCSKHHTFNEVVQKLIEKGIKFMIHYPARLILLYNRQEHSFLSMEDARLFLTLWSNYFFWWVVHLQMSPTVMTNI